MDPNASARSRNLWPMFHHSPVAMAETDGQGTLRQVNPKAVQVMMPLAMHLGLSGENLLDTLGGYLPAVRQAVVDFGAESGPIIQQEPYTIRFTSDLTTIDRYFSLTIEKDAPDRLLIFFEDVTDFLIKADLMRQRL